MCGTTSRLILAPVQGAGLLEIDPGGLRESTTRLISINPPGWGSGLGLRVAQFYPRSSGVSISRPPANFWQPFRLTMLLLKLEASKLWVMTSPNERETVELLKSSRGDKRVLGMA